MSAYPGKSYITQKMADIVVRIMRPYTSLAERKDYETEEDFLFSRVTRWADERVLWDIAEQKVFLEGFPYWFKVAKERVEEELNAALRPHVAEKKEAALTLISAEMAQFEADFGVKPVEADVPDSLLRLLHLGGERDALKGKIKYHREEYGKHLILYSDETVGRYRQIPLPESL